MTLLVPFRLGYERNFYRFGKKWIDSKDVPYDYGSIMHSNRAFFSRFPVMLDTLIPLRHVDIGQRRALSKFDILQANLLYQCDGECCLDFLLQYLAGFTRRKVIVRKYILFCLYRYN